MKMGNKLLSVIISLGLIGGIIPNSAFAADTIMLGTISGITNGRFENAVVSTAALISEIELTSVGCTITVSSGEGYTAVGKGTCASTVSFTEPVSAQLAQSIIRTAVTISKDAADDASVTVVLKLYESNLPTGVEVEKMKVDGAEHYYAYIDGDISWTQAYNSAKSYKFMGLTGYLATITSAAEQNFLKSISSKSAWIGASRYTDIGDGIAVPSGTAEGNAYFYWDCGPERKSLLYTYMNESNSLLAPGAAYAAFASGRPDNKSENISYAYNQTAVEPCVAMNTDSSGGWDDLSDSAGVVSGYFVEFSEYGSNTASVKNVSDTAEINGIEALATPQISVSGENLYGFDAAGNYTVNGNAVTILSGGALKIDQEWYGTTVSIIKKGNGVTSLDSVAQHLYIASLVTKTDLSAITYEAAGAKLKNTTTELQYNVDNTQWLGCSDNETTGVIAGNGSKIVIRQKNLPTNTRTLTVVMTVKPEAPKNLTVDYENEKLLNYNYGTMEYSVNGGASFILGKLDESISDIIPTNGSSAITLKVRYAKTADTAESDAVDVNLSVRSAAPEFSKTDETAFGLNNGTLTVTGGLAEYKAEGGVYQDVSAAEITSLKPGTYYVRTKATVSSFASYPATAVIDEGFNIEKVFGEGNAQLVSSPVPEIQSVKLLKDITTADEIEITKSIILDLNGYNIAAGVNSPAILVNGSNLDITITDSEGGGVIRGYNGKDGDIGENGGDAIDVRASIDCKMLIEKNVTIKGGIGGVGNVETGGTGGAGIVGAGLTLTIEGSVYGGDGGFANSTMAGRGGAAVDLTTGTVINNGTVNGGNGGNSTSGLSGAGGSGIICETGDVAVGGMVTGGNGGTSYASTGTGAECIISIGSITGAGVFVNGSNGVRTIFGGGDGGSSEGVTLLPTCNVTASYAIKQFELKLTGKQKNSVIYYTLDGKYPTTSSNVYDGPIVLKETVTLKFIEVGSTTSNVVTRNIKIVDNVASISTNANKTRYIEPVSSSRFYPDEAITRNDVLTSLYKLLTFQRKSNYLTTEFTDVNDDMASIVAYFQSSNIIDGYNDYSFGGSRGLTRAEFVKIMSIILNLNTTNYNASYSDIRGHWAQDYIARFTQLGYLRGYDDGEFKPDREMTRAEFVTIVNRITGMKVTNATSIFNDVENIYWAKNDIMAAYIN